MNAISLKLPKSLLNRIEEEARIRRRTKSAVVRDCLTESLVENRKRGALTCHDIAGHLAGSVSGSSDLATRKDHYLRIAIRKHHARNRKRSR